MSRDPKRRIPAILLAVVLLAMITACSNRPDGIPSKGEMADLLSDMYKLDAYWSITDGPVKVQNDSVRKVYRQEVLKRHGMTEQQFEKVMKWYAHHIEDLVEVHDMVDKKLEKQIASASNQSDKQTMSGNMSIAEGDNLWEGLPVYVLRKGGGKDGIQFDMNAPATLKKGDMLRWQMGATARRSAVRMVLGVDYADGTVMYATRQMMPTDNGDMYVNLQTDSTQTVKRIFGVLRYKVGSGEVVLLDSIALSRHPLDSKQYSQIGSQYRYRRDGKIQRPSAKPVSDTVKLIPPANKENNKVIKEPGAGLKPPKMPVVTKKTK